jgi:hypothetical protein
LFSKQNIRLVTEPQLASPVRVAERDDQTQLLAEQKVNLIPLDLRRRE